MLGVGAGVGWERLVEIGDRTGKVKILEGGRHEKCSWVR